jgi:formylglycine-generating enzyme required for sulfatase activity
MTVCGDDVQPAAAAPQTETKRPEGAGRTAGGKVDGTEEKEKTPEELLAELFGKDENITNTLSMVMVWVPEGYRVAQYEVTQAQYEQVTGDNPSKFSGPQRPVDNATWNEAAAFCRKLTEQELAAKKLPKGYDYVLPTEQQWEYYVADTDLKNAITSFLGDRRNPENVGGLSPNNLGLYDVRGNVWEWCSTPVARGASWRSFEDFLAVGLRFVAPPDKRYDDIGFRVVLQGKAESAPKTSDSPLVPVAPKPQKAKAY